MIVVHTELHGNTEKGWQEGKELEEPSGNKRAHFKEIRRTFPIKGTKCTSKFPRDERQHCTSEKP